MKKLVSILLTIVLIGTVCIVPATAETITTTPVEMQPIKISPIAYTSDFDAYSNVVGVLNSDGTKTAYIFASPADAAQVDAITGLVSPVGKPSAELNAGASQNLVLVEDATVYSGTPNVNYGNEQQLYLGEHETRGYARTYMKFDLSGLTSYFPSYKNILSASLGLNYQGLRLTSGVHWTQDVNRFAIFEMYTVKTTWTEAEITWNNRPDYYNDRIVTSNYKYQTPSELPYEWQDFYLTQMVMGWLQGLPNYGVVIKEKDDQYIAAFHSAEASTESYRPYLTITYTTETAPTGQGINTSSQSYYIVNRQTGQCLTASSSSFGSGLTARAGDPTYTDRQIWRFASAGGGYYKIQLGNTGLYLCNSATGEPSLGSFIGLPQDIWMVERNWNGTYRFRNTISTAQYLTTDGEDIYDIGDVFQGDYVCDMNHLDEWSLVPASSGIATLFGMESEHDLNTTDGMDTIAAELSERNYTANVYVNQPASLGFAKLQTSDVYFFSQHGLPGQMLFYEGMNGDEEVSSNIVTAGAGDYSLQSLSNNALNRLRLINISACETGANYADGYTTDNMTGRMYWLGAHNIISHFHNTSEVSGLMWDNSFMTNILLGRSLGTAKMRADYLVCQDTYLLGEPLYTYDANVRHELGDNTYRPCYDMSTQVQTRSYQYNDIMQLTYSATPSPESSVYEVDAINPIPLDKRFAVPLDNDSTGGGIQEYDVYTDSDGGIYWYYEGTNQLHSYEPYIENLSLGDTLVNREDALWLTEMFLDVSQYNYDGFIVTASNDFSKNFTVEYTKGDERLIFQLQADEYGYAYIVSFTAYNYTGQ